MENFKSVVQADCP